MASRLSGSAACRSSRSTTAPSFSTAMSRTSRTIPSSASRRSCAAERSESSVAPGHSGSTRRRPRSSGDIVDPIWWPRNQDRSASAMTLNATGVVIGARPVRTARPSRRPAAAASPISRVLPTPPSPSMRMQPASPARAARTARRSRSSSTSRPTTTAARRTPTVPGTATSLLGGKAPEDVAGRPPPRERVGVTPVVPRMCSGGAREHHAGVDCAGNEQGAIRMAFEDVMGIVSRWMVATEAFAALGAELTLKQSGETAPPEIVAALRGVSVAAGIGDLDELTPPQQQMVAAMARTYIHQAADLLGDPARAAGWTFTDPAILDGWGRGSMMVPMLIAATPELREVERFLDVGTGVGLLAVSAAGVWPNATIVGIDRWDPSLERGSGQRHAGGPRRADHVAQAGARRARRRRRVRRRVGPDVLPDGGRPRRGAAAASCVRRVREGGSRSVAWRRHPIRWPRRRTRSTSSEAEGPTSTRSGPSKSSKKPVAPRCTPRRGWVRLRSS